MNENKILVNKVFINSICFQILTLSFIEKFAFLNFKGESLDFVKINGTNVDKTQNIFRGNKIYLPTDKLKEENVVDVRFTGTYRNDGVGLHRSVDPEDNEIYMYTQFEAFNANKCFPCFDQPDLKAQLSFYSFSPANWKVVSCEFESDTTNSSDIYGKFINKIGCPLDISSRFTEDDNVIFRKFTPTEKISTYLYAFIVGPYEYIRNSADNAKDYVPMRVFARKSMMKYVKVKDLFRVTMAGMDYYKYFFGCKYPFKKYDQVYCYEFNSGAMENVGCVTITERYLNRGKIIPQGDREQHAITVLHELAHMWFGDLVTMKWWDDLWLNESFATFMSHMALKYARGLDDYTLSWELFLGDKSWGLRTDQFSTTHPIVADCINTEDAENIFDGISYGKGASFLKQLVSFVSEKTFKIGLKTYFSKYAFQNTEFADFISELQNACDECKLGFDLKAWADSWINTSGFNIFEPQLNETGGAHSRIDEFKIRQTMSTYGKNCLREQKILIALFYDNFKKTDVKSIHIKAKDETIIPELVGQPTPDAYLLNYEDWGYGMFLLDEKSLNAFKDNLLNIQDSLSRKLIYNSLFFMTRDAKFPANKFIQIIKNQIIHESNQDIVEEQVYLNLNLILKYYIADEYVTKECEDMFNFLLYDYIPIAANEELKEIILNAIISIACTEEHFKLMKQWVEANEVFFMKDGIKIEIVDLIIAPESKFSILKKVASSKEMNPEEIKKFYEHYLENDENKDLARRCKLTCEALAYNKESKEKFWNMVTCDKPELSSHDQHAIMRGLMPRNQIDIVEPYVNKFFDVIPRIIETRIRDDRDGAYYALTPLQFASEELLEKYKKLLKENNDKNKTLSIRLKDDIERIEKYLQGKKCI